MTTRKTMPEYEEERDLDVEPSQEYERYVEYEREHGDEDERTYGEVVDDELGEDFVPEDPSEYDQG